MNANYQYIQLLCQFKIAMRRQAIHIDLENFIHDIHYQQRCIQEAIQTGCPQLHQLINQLLPRAA